MSEYTAHPEYRALLAAVLAAPADDLPRLVLADWLDEHHQPERAEFTRVQCELAKYGPLSMAEVYHAKQVERDGECDRPWCVLCDLRGRQDRLWAGLSARLESDVARVGWQLTFNPIRLDRRRPGVVVRRGFVAEVRCGLADWTGGVCGPCDGLGERPVYGALRPGGGEAGRGTLACRDCSGTGRTAGVGRRVVAEHPVEVVRLTDREPAEVDRSTIGADTVGAMAHLYHWLGEADRFWMWMTDVPPDTSGGLTGQPRERFPDSFIPAAVFDDTLRHLWETRGEADDAVSARLIAWARSQPAEAAT